MYVTLCFNKNIKIKPARNIAHFMHSGYQRAAHSEPGFGQEPRRRAEPRHAQGLHRGHPGATHRKDDRRQGHEGHHQDGGGLGQDQGQWVIGSSSRSGASCSECQTDDLVVFFCRKFVGCIY